MTPEIVTTLAAAAGMFVALGGLIVSLFLWLRSDMHRVRGELRDDIAAVEARLSGDMVAVEARLRGEMAAVEARLRGWRRSRPDCAAISRRSIGKWTISASASPSGERVGGSRGNWSSSRISLLAETTCPRPGPSSGWRRPARRRRRLSPTRRGYAMRNASAGSHGQEHA